MPLLTTCPAMKWRCLQAELRSSCRRLTSSGQHCTLGRHNGPTTKPSHALRLFQQLLIEHLCKQRSRSTSVHCTPNPTLIERFCVAIQAKTNYSHLEGIPNGAAMGNGHILIEWRHWYSELFLRYELLHYIEVLLYSIKIKRYQQRWNRLKWQDNAASW